MKKIILLFFLCLISKNIFSQVFNLDSLLKVLPTQKEDTVKVRTLVRICNNYLLTDLKKAIECSKEVLSLSQQIKWKKGMAFSYSLSGSAYYYLGNFPEALKYRQNELKIWEELNNEKNICMTLANLAALYSDMGDNVKALEQYLYTLKLADKIKNTETTTITLCNIGVLYKETNEYAKALEYFNKSLTLSQQNNYEHLTSINLTNIGGIYTDQKQVSKGLALYKKAIEIDKKIGNYQTMEGNLVNIGGAYQLLSDSAKEAGNIELTKETNDQALFYFTKALNLAYESGNKPIEANALGNIGAIYLAQEKYSDAEKYIKQSLDIAISLSINDLIQYDYQQLCALFKKTRKYKDALECLEKYNTLNDSIYSQQSKKAISELQIKYDTEKKETENAKLDQKNKILELSVTNNKYLIFGLTSLSLFIFGIGFLVIRQNKLRSKQENANLEQKLLRTQMNPHFIFNSLANIESFIYEHQPKEAGDYLAQFARLMRLILENSSSEYITLDKELETLKYYFSLQKLRLNDNLDYSINVDEAIDKSQILLPPMLTQPFIENAIEHGFRGITETGKVKVSFLLKENNMEIKVTDNGIGIVKAQQQKDLYKKHNSMAMKITYERLNFLNKSKNQKLVFSIKELEHNQGTEVIFSIPV